MFNIQLGDYQKWSLSSRVKSKHKPMRDVQECFYQKDFLHPRFGVLIFERGFIGGRRGLTVRIIQYNTFCQLCFSWLLSWASLWTSQTWLVTSAARRMLERRSKLLLETSWEGNSSIRYFVLIQRILSDGALFSSNSVCSSKNIHTQPQGRPLEIARGRGVQKQGKYEAKLKFPEGWGGGGDFKSKHLPW